MLKLRSLLFGLLGSGLCIAGALAPATARAEVNVSFVDIGVLSPKDVIDYTETHPLGEYVMVHYQNDIFPPSVICCDDTASLDALGVWCESSWGATYWGDWPDYACGGEWGGYDWSSGGSP